ncbi:hypothetical protein BDW02DRAFT_563736 [Decorospora gaudefroyi]|uniref:Uncharacterized protein n=1 Tax=Decorospora gaudefroyi TaxID=184978 RepID=A0A6A5L0D1_9PLEO|nr:hypothetical protein BDW02DRAFT_563736 [Decorospora gaudefroyi]
MADSATEEYKIQVISGRYIRSSILVDYVESRKDEFGAQWKLKLARDNRISFTALRHLTKDELDKLQEESQSARTPNQGLFVD